MLAKVDARLLHARRLEVSSDASAHERRALRTATVPMSARGLPAADAQALRVQGELVTWCVRHLISQSFITESQKQCSANFMECKTIFF